MTRNQGQQAGDNSEQYSAGRDIVVVQNGITYTEAKAIALEVFEKNAPKLTSQAEAVICDRRDALNGQIVERIYNNNAANLDRFGDPRILAALVSAQRSFAETGREDLGDILCGLVSDLAAEPEPTRREIVLRSAIDCAPRLTRLHFNALCVIFSLRMRIHYVPHFDPLPARLDDEFRPLYGEIPTAPFDYSYMGSTDAGKFYGGLGASPYKTIYEHYANALYAPFKRDELPESFFDEVPKDDQQASILMVIPEDADQPIGPDTRYRITYELSQEILSENFQTYAAFTGWKKALREFLKRRMISMGQLKTRIQHEQPDLYEFMNQLERTRAMDFELSPIGIMLARQHLFSRSPEQAAQIDQLFEF